MLPFTLAILHDLAGGGSMPEWGGADEAESGSSALDAVGGLILAALMGAFLWALALTIVRLVVS